MGNRFIKYEVKVYLVLFSFIIIVITSGLTYGKISGVKSASLPSCSEELVNTIQNGGNPIKLVINAGSLYAPKYVKLGQITKINVTSKVSEIPLFIYLKNKNLLSYDIAKKINKPQIDIATNHSNWHVFLKNLIPEPNSIHYGIIVDDLSNKTGDITIKRIYDKNNKQILIKPITFKIQLLQKK